MTQRNNFPQTIQAMPTGVVESLRVALGLAAIAASALVIIITVLTGAGFGHV